MVNYCMYKVKVIVTLVFTVLLAAYVFAVAPWEIDDLTGREMPSFTLKDMSGNTVTESTFKGKVLLINFWATWCAPCKVEMPSLNSLFNKLKDKGFMILAISVDESDEAVSKFLKDTPLDFPVLRDREIDISAKYKVYAYPTTFLIDSKGIVREHYIGESDWMEGEPVKTIEKVLAE